MVSIPSRFDIRVVNTVPNIHIDGGAVTGLMNWNRKPTLEDTAIFRDAGLTFYSFMGNLCLDAPDGVPDEEREFEDAALPRMRMTPENIDRTMEMLLSVNPRLKILPRIILNAPVWWKKRHPDEVMKQYNLAAGEFQDGPTASSLPSRWCGDQVFRAADGFGLHAKFDGALDVPFEQEYTYVNYHTGENQHGRTLHLSLKRGETVLWKLLS
ncbi:MAG: hypothetical protein IJJ26_09690 [Victivallales bacterium]|nr:hypothetical protein [Victivallales bacterium]